MVYFNQRPYAPKSKQETDQWGQVLTFQSAFPSGGLWWPYRGAAEFASLLRRHLSAFVLDAFPLSTAAPLRGSANKADISRPPAYFSVQVGFIEENTRSFVGREKTLDAFKAFRARNRRGYFLIRGGPGQGKTALACALAKSNGCPHHFISRTGGRDDPRLILRSLLAQMQPEAADGIPESIPDLTKTFEEKLARVAVPDGAVVIIDGLDELPECGADAPYLPADALPDGTYFMVTARPGDHFDSLRRRLFAVPFEVHELGPLEVRDMEQILRTKRPATTEAELERIETASQGNPLYLRAVADQLHADPGYDLATLPDAIDGFFHAATRGLAFGNALLADALGVLAVARKPLPLRELSAILQEPQRNVHEKGIVPVQQFLLEIEGGYTFYHAAFHDFVRRTVLYEDELRQAHRKVAMWLNKPDNRDNPYRLHSLAHHLFEAGERDRLLESINEEFLLGAAQRLGYSVLESLELLTRAWLERREPTAIDRCVHVVEALRRKMGDDIVTELVGTLRPYRAGPRTFRTRLIEPPLPPSGAVDAYVGILPKAEVPADFFELVPVGERLLLAIGDAPSVGLKSAFVARFLANVFHHLVLEGNFRDLGGLLTATDGMIRGYDYFRRISMQCAAVDPRRGIVRIASAGHPYPVHYAKKRSRCDVLALPGDVLYSCVPGETTPRKFEEFALEMHAGDMLVMVTDGLTEAQVLNGDPYGYRFTNVIESRARDSARAVGRAILDDWKAHPREMDAGDDVTLVVMKIKAEPERIV